MQRIIKIEEINETREKKLPICFPPPITSYLPYSVLSSIICANESSYNWIYNNFIQLYHNGFGKEDYYPNSDFAYQDKLYLSATELNEQNYKLNFKSFIDDMLFWIDNGNYIVIYLAESQIPGTRFYKKSDIIHSQFIFGYHKEKKNFYMMNFSAKSEKLDILELKFDEIIPALKYTIKINMARKNTQSITMRDFGKDFRLILLKYNFAQSVSYDPKINLPNIRQQLQDLINGNNSSIHNLYFTSSQNATWGLATYDLVKKRLYEELSEGVCLDYRIMFMLYEHKKIMKQRMDYLEKKFSIKNYPDEILGIIQLAEILKNTTLKFNITKNKNTLVGFEAQIEEMRKLEIDLYEKYIAGIIV